MELLYWLESIRNPVLDWFFSILTYLGDEPVFLVLGLFLYWCVDKYEGYYLMAVGFLGTAVNQVMKVAFRIPRPWVLDENFSIVESARERATGYSFPSGHTQFSVGTFAGLARWGKNKILRGVCIAVCLLVPLSRMYLGVHTPLDVGVAALCALVLVFGLYPWISRAREDEKIMLIFLPVMAALLGVGLIYMYTWNFPADIDMTNLLSGQKSLWTLLGAVVGMFFAYLLDIKVVHFDTKASPVGQLLKLVLGLGLALGLKEGLKPVLNPIFGDLAIRHCLRYGIMVFVACGVWPMTFKWFAKIGAKKEKQAELVQNKQEDDYE